MLHHKTRHAYRQRPLVAGRFAKLAQFVEAGVGATTDSPRTSTQQRARGDAHRRPIRCIFRQSISDLACSSPACMRRNDVAVGQPCSGPHVPGICSDQIFRSFQVLGDQGRVLVCGTGIASLDRFRQAPVQHCAVCFQLRFVGHGANQRMVECILCAWGEPHLIDQLAARSAIRPVNPDAEVSGPNNSAIRAVDSESFRGASVIIWAPGVLLSALR
jgi:hypothetical protein